MKGIKDLTLEFIKRNDRWLDAKFTNTILFHGRSSLNGFKAYIRMIRVFFTRNIHAFSSLLTRFYLYFSYRNDWKVTFHTTRRKRASHNCKRWTGFDSFRTGFPLHSLSVSKIPAFYRVSRVRQTRGTIRVDKRDCNLFPTVEQAYK